MVKSPMSAGRHRLSLSVTLTPTAIAAIKSRSGGERGRYGLHSDSAALCRMAERYDHLITQATPHVELAEWRLICDALNGTAMLDAWSPNYVTMEIADHCRLNGAGETWGVDGAALVARLNTMTMVERFAVVDVADRFWAAVARGEEPKLPGEDAPATAS
jgi:hypothetical protein